ncbi:hypothetical protein ASF49_21320 [Methylobacterium sp. Leaf104]|uniref:hypothetical protein n=1 Tax=Methylobacterium TaxID=407 RepID=UPI0006FF0101|nr:MULTISPECIES: hypothetical protein [Methylobacterium]KQP40048.1 hypothetical protein ASF49_21320 [Methylobacterium sp. Leaf104]MCI9881928.1 hypothetical protein [Methylobacterium goesingense]
MRRDHNARRAAGPGCGAAPPLHLPFPPSEIARLASGYRLDAKERAACAAGARIRNGACTRENLAPILTWKVSDRGRSRPQRNSDEEVADALRIALLAATPRVAVSVLTGLSGVAVPVASAILAAIRPEHYTVIDPRGLKALGCGPLQIGAKASLPLDLYLHYLGFCRDIALRCGVTLQILERALWEWARLSDDGWMPPPRPAARVPGRRPAAGAIDGVRVPIVPSHQDLPLPAI